MPRSAHHHSRRPCGCCRPPPAPRLASSCQAAGPRAASEGPPRPRPTARGTVRPAPRAAMDGARGPGPAAGLRGHP
eukprot:10868884-Alexandrium_andersonii.AAC.1